MQIDKGRIAMEEHLADLARSGSAAAVVHQRVVQALQAVQREKEAEIRRMQAAAGGASEAERREMATVVQAKEAA